MKVRGDVESVNLRTGERFQRVTGKAQSRLESLGRPLNDEERACLEAFGRHMRDEVIPSVERTMRHRAEAAEKNRHRILLLTKGFKYVIPKIIQIRTSDYACSKG